MPITDQDREDAIHQIYEMADNQDLYTLLPFLPDEVIEWLARDHRVKALNPEYDYKWWGNETKEKKNND